MPIRDVGGDEQEDVARFGNAFADRGVEGAGECGTDDAMHGGIRACGEAGQKNVERPPHSCPQAAPRFVDLALSGFHVDQMQEGAQAALIADGALPRPLRREHALFAVEQPCAQSVVHALDLGDGRIGIAGPTTEQQEIAQPRPFEHARVDVSEQSQAFGQRCVGPLELHQSVHGALGLTQGFDRELVRGARAARFVGHEGLAQGFGDSVVFAIAIEEQESALGDALEHWRIRIELRGQNRTQHRGGSGTEGWLVQLAEKAGHGFGHVGTTGGSDEIEHLFCGIGLGFDDPGQAPNHAAQKTGISTDRLTLQEIRAGLHPLVGIRDEGGGQGDGGTTPLGWRQLGIELEIDLLAQAIVHCRQESSGDRRMPPDQRFAIGEQTPAYWAHLFPAQDLPW